MTDSRAQRPPVPKPTAGRSALGAGGGVAVGLCLSLFGELAGDGVLSLVVVTATFCALELVFRPATRWVATGVLLGLLPGWYFLAVFIGLMVSWGFQP